MENVKGHRCFAPAHPPPTALRFTDSIPSWIRLLPPIILKDAPGKVPPVRSYPPAKVQPLLGQPDRAARFEFPRIHLPFVQIHTIQRPQEGSRRPDQTSVLQKERRGTSKVRGRLIELVQIRCVRPAVYCDSRCETCAAMSFRSPFGQDTNTIP